LTDGSGLVADLIGSLFCDNFLTGTAASRDFFTTSVNPLISVPLDEVFPILAESSYFEEPDFFSSTFF
jgi:hypothetical protein